MRPNKTVAKVSATVIAEHVCGMMNTGMSFYVEFELDSTHEMRPNKTVAKVSATVIAEHVCGMMNTGMSLYVEFELARFHP